MNYSTLLRRSVDSDEYFKLPGIGLYAELPERARAAAAAFARPAPLGPRRGQRLRPQPDDRPAGRTRPPHEVLLQAALGDHQVANVTAEVEARTVGASVYSPGAGGRRHWEVEPVHGLPQVDDRSGTPYTGGSMLVYYDGGPVSVHRHPRRRARRPRRTRTCRRAPSGVTAAIRTATRGRPHDGLLQEGIVPPRRRGSALRRRGRLLLLERLDRRSLTRAAIRLQPARCSTQSTAR